MSTHPRGLADAAAHQLVEGDAARPLGDQGEHDVAAVAVGEPLAGRELGRVAAEHGEVVLRLHELVDGDGHQVGGEVEVFLLVEVVADARPVRRAAARPSRRRRSAADRRRAPTAPSSRAGASPLRSGSPLRARSGSSSRSRSRSVSRSCSGSRSRGGRSRTPWPARSAHRGPREPPRRSRSPPRPCRSPAPAPSSRPPALGELRVGALEHVGEIVAADAQPARAEALQHRRDR